MKLKYFLCLVALGLTIAANATPKKASKKKPKANLRLVEAYTQKILPGIPRSPVETGTHLIIIWESDKMPETFFWRGDAGWLTCYSYKAHKIIKRTHNTPEGLDYTGQKVGVNGIHKGDTIELRPVSGGKFAIPDEIPADAKNTLFYKTGGSGWLAFPIKTIGKKQDVAMP